MWNTVQLTERRPRGAVAHSHPSGSAPVPALGLQPGAGPTAALMGVAPPGPGGGSPWPDSGPGTSGLTQCPRSWRLRGVSNSVQRVGTTSTAQADLRLPGRWAGGWAGGELSPSSGDCRQVGHRPHVEETGGIPGWPGRALPVPVTTAGEVRTLDGGRDAGEAPASCGFLLPAGSGLTPPRAPAPSGEVDVGGGLGVL